jgi:hypothetical protein
MIQKTYQALQYQTYDMYVKIGDKAVLVAFRGGTLRPDVKGTYVTTDPVMQAALDKDTSNGLTFKEIATFDDEADTVEELDENGKNADGITEVSGITEVQAAKDYIIANVDGITASSVPNKTAVLAIAAQHKIVFTDLPK